ncbi:MAG: F0F1-type synthase subunit b, F-type H+-transporting ATPase subunit b [Candidatus Parcubacteria bacterium]|jgi:F-type H+-transporting ATPase subunit b
MEQLIHAFGIDARLILIQVVNFGLLMVVLSYLLYKPVLKMLNERQEKIAQGMKDAEEAGKARLEATEKKKGIIASANKEAEAMSARAKEHADKKADDILTEAQKKAEQVVKDAAMRGEEMKVQARKESEAEIAKLAILAAEKVLKEKAS